MNSNLYSLTDLFKTEIADKVKSKLNLPVLNYQFGYVEDLETELKKLREPGYADQKFPLIWLAMPLTIKRDSNFIFGRCDTLKVFIMMNTDINYTPSQRIEISYKTKINPIYDTMLDKLKSSSAFDIKDLSHTFTDMLYWGEGQANVLADPVDCKEIRFSNLLINLKSC